MKRFKSQICTTKEQSERLLALGLKEETADLWLTDCFVGCMSTPMVFRGDEYKATENKLCRDDVLAWSLHRLIEISEVSVEVSGLFVRINSTYYYEERDNVYDNLIDAIQELINNDVFNKEYLKEEPKWYAQSSTPSSWRHWYSYS